MRRAALLLALSLSVPLSVGSAQVKVQIEGRVSEIPLEKYVAGVLAGEASLFRSDEALEAMAVVARTYAVRERGRHSAEGFDFCSTTHCQRLDLGGITPRLEHAVQATAGELLWYRGKLAFTPYSLDCGGRTEDAAAVWPDQRAPYLESHADEYCLRAGGGEWHWSGDLAGIAAALRRQGLQTPARITGIRVTGRTASGRARTLELLGEQPIPIAAGAFRFALGRELGWNTVRSDWFDVDTSGARVVVRGRGSGHGAGLCQRGADEMGIEGRGYRDILAFYFPGAEVGASARGFSWTRLGGESVALLTTEPSRDTPILAAAERDLRVDLQRTGWSAPRRIEIRVYPDVAAFRDATGEPGWVAAYSHSSQIEMQPGPEAQSTVGHEIWHVLVESQAAPGLPLWFREGLVEYLSGRAAPGGRTPSDEELRQTRDAAVARRAYADAAGAVARLAQRYGETALLRWVKSGIPSNASKPATNSK